MAIIRMYDPVFYILFQRQGNGEGIVQKEGERIKGLLIKVIRQCNLLLKVEINKLKEHVVGKHYNVFIIVVFVGTEVRSSRQGIG